ncbi:hypothetical protein COOONC_15035 [Cooperia oncophora]
MVAYTVAVVEYVRVRVKGPCSMDLVDFPMDTQSCRLNYQSFSYNNEEVQMRWNKRRHPVFVLKPINISDFWGSKAFTRSIIRAVNPFNLIHYLEAKLYYQFIKARALPSRQLWNELVVTFCVRARVICGTFCKPICRHIFTIFISWLAFVLGPQAITPRTMIGVNALLSCILLFRSIMRNLPRVSYIKAIDVWMLSSNGPFRVSWSTYLKLAIVGFKERQKCSSFVSSTLVQLFTDRLCTRPLVFPAVFSVFNIAYWARYGMKIG